MNPRAALEIPERYEILLVVALGKPAETVVLEDVGPAGGSSYGTAWRLAFAKPQTSTPRPQAHARGADAARTRRLERDQ